MHIKYIILFFVSLSVIAFASENSQKKLQLDAGFSLAFNKTFHNYKYSAYPFNGCSTYWDGSAYGFSMGLSAELTNTMKCKPQDSYLFHLNFQTLPSRSVMPQGKNYYLKMGVDGKYYSDSVSIFTGMYLTLQTISMDILYNLRTIGENFSMSLGLTIDIAVNTAETKTYYLEGDDSSMKIADELNPFIYPSGTRLSQDKRTIIYEKNSIPKMAPLRIGAKIGFAYKIKFDKFIILPFIHYNYGITQMGTVSGWRINALQAGADILFNIF